MIQTNQIRALQLWKNLLFFCVREEREREEEEKMVRPYAVKWLKTKNKKRRREEEEEEDQKEVEQEKTPVSTSEAPPLVREEKEEVTLLPGLPVVPAADHQNKPGVIFVLEKACLRVGKVGKKEQILSGDEHATFLKRQNLNPADFRPDILHQALLSILDRPLTKAGRLQALYVKTDDGELFEVKPHVRLPRTFKRFSGLMYQLKSEKRINASGKREHLFRMIKNPVTRHLPANARKIGFSFSSDKLVKMPAFVGAASDDVPLVFVIGSMAHGKIEADYTDELISVSEYPLSAACCISRVCEALEQKWNIL